MLSGTRSGLSDVSDLIISFIDVSPLDQVTSFKYLGLWIDPLLSFKHHIESITNKLSCNLAILYRSINCFTLQVRKRIVTQLLLPILDYADIVYQNTFETHLQPLNSIYNSLCRFILRCPYRTHHCSMYESLNWLPLNSRRHHHWLQCIFKCIHFKCPLYLKQYLIPFTSPYPLRHTQQPFFFVPKTNKEFSRWAFKFKAPSDWNILPNNIRIINSFCIFKNSLFYFLKMSSGNVFFTPIINIAILCIYA